MIAELAANYKSNGKLNLIVGSPKTRSNIQAVGFVDKNFIPAIGQALPVGIVIAGSTNVTISNLAEVIRKSALMGKGIFFTDPMINGTRKATETKAGSKFGSQVVEEAVNEEDVRMDLTYAGATQDMNGLRRLRGNSNRDAFVFTNNTVEIIRADRDNLSITDVDAPIDGDTTKTIVGMFSLNAHLMPNFSGDYDTYYGNIGDIKTPCQYTITQGALTALTASVCNGEFRRYVATATQGTIAVSTGVAEGCQTWSLYAIVNGVQTPVSGATQATCNVLSGLVTVPTTHATGVTQYVLMVENSAGVWGQFKFEIEK